ncbi:MAG: PH domain-containing protein, partial [Candidatus Thorarchaeota archaeon]|nr:PH domain-containing protein [Candidatus Thorarchaeota archaeon]
MAQEEGRVIRPPIEQVTSGRVFQPANAFIGKKMLKAGIIMIFIGVGLQLLFIGFTNPIFLDIIFNIFEPIELLVLLGWETANLVYIIGATIVFVIGSVYVYIYVKRIEYSAMGWSGDTMPEIYTKRGIITITKRHVPFRTVVHVETRRGVFDRIMGIGTVLIETAGGAKGQQVHSLAPLLIQRLGGGNKSEERVEGIRFHQELRDFILREMRNLGSAPLVHEHIDYRKSTKRIFTNQTLEAFKEVRDALKETR